MADFGERYAPKGGASESIEWRIYIHAGIDKSCGDGRFADDPVQLPADVTNAEYASICQSIFSLLDIVGMRDEATVIKDERVADIDLNAAFDRHRNECPGGN
jgi:hypothetical protein